jgi:hypothetical protein
MTTMHMSVVRDKQNPEPTHDNMLLAKMIWL